MGISTEHGGDKLPNWLLAASKKVVDRIDPSQYAELYRLSSNARQTILGAPSEWRPFDELLVDEGIDRNNRDHVTALLLVVMPIVVQQEKFARFAATQEAKARLEKLGVQPSWGNTGNFAVSTASSSSINKAADDLASSLERLAKK